jgi:hypothetical protein
MAYPTVDKPYGLKPINLIGGQVFAGATRQRRIASSAASIGYGDPVELTSSGTICLHLDDDASDRWLCRCVLGLFVCLQRDGSADLLAGLDFGHFGEVRHVRYGVCG